MINVGIIGCGKIAQTRHLPEYNSNPYVKIIAVYDFNKERAESIAREYGAKAYDSYQQLIEDSDIDAVSVCVRNVDHCKISVDAMKAGKSVLCEKPMAVSLDECEEMVHVSKETGKFLMIGHNQRFTKAHAKAKELLDNGAIGSILTFKTCFGHQGPESWTVDSNNVWFFDSTLSVFGAMADLGVHKTDLICFLTGQRIKKVSAVLQTLDKKNSKGEHISVDDNAICIYQMENGIIGTMTVSWTYYGAEDNSTIIYGTKGIMRIYDDEKYSIVIEGRDGTKICYQLDQIQTNDKQTSSGVIDQWVESLMNNKSPLVSGEEAMYAMKAIFAALESSKTGKEITIKY